MTNKQEQFMLVVHNIDQPGNLYNTLIEHTVNITILYNLNKDTTTILRWWSSNFMKPYNYLVC